VAALPMMAPAGVEPAPSRLRAGSSAVIELRSLVDVTGRDRTCAAPRFKRALYPLSYGHVFMCDLLFMPLACPSALDRGVCSRASYVGGLWSPMLACVMFRKQGMRCTPLCVTGHFGSDIARTFLSQAGPQFGANVFSS
jgi:hypothetical protein